MLDWEAVLTHLYVQADAFCRPLPAEVRPGPPPALAGSELLTLALFARFRRFASERDFYRWAEAHLRSAFPTLPHRAQFNRQVRRQRVLLERFALTFADQLHAAEGPFEALDRTAAPTRHCKRRGRGWLPGRTALGSSNRLGWFHGFAVRVSVHPEGAITGWGFGPGSAKDQPLAEVLFAARAEVRAGRPTCRLPTATGAPRVCLTSAGSPQRTSTWPTRGSRGRVPTGAGGSSMGRR